MSSQSDLEEGNDASNSGQRKASAAAFDHGTYNLDVQNLSYKISKRVGKEVVEKTLLSNVSAHARHGQILAVVGPSGAGKSTFLDAIAGRIDPNSLQGAILVNKNPVDSSFKRLSGYVMQDDQLFPMLTVEETLMFSARLRLPGNMSHAEKQERVQLLIDELGLGSCAKTFIGNAEVRGVSGGERRRVSIGVDLIHDPAVLFLDEPTSGLDSTAALNVIQNLHEIAESRKRTIILTIHQPSFRILNLIHNFLILARGNVVYHGPYAGMIPFFKEYGSVVPEHVNGLEYALDLVEEVESKEGGLDSLVKFCEEKTQESRQLGVQSSMGAMGDIRGKDFATSFVSEVAVLSYRNFKNIFRTPELFLARIGLMCITGLVLGSLFLNSRHSPKGVSNRASYFAFALALLLFTSTEALPIFLEERQIYIRETSRGAYRTISYVLSGAVVFLPFLFVLALVFSCVGYFMVGLAFDAGAFFTFVATMFMTLAVANSYVIFFAAFVPNFITGNTIITATTAFFFLFSGFFISKSNIPDYWIWLHYLSTFKYPIEVLFKNEFGTLSSECWNRSLKETGVCNQSGKSQGVLDSFGMHNVRIWLNFLVMIIFFVGYRTFFYVALRFQTASVRK